MPPTGLRKYVFVVEGTGEFPKDMLRWDNAIAFTENDQRRIDADLEDAIMWDAETKHAKRARVSLVTTTPHLLTPKRWQSFTWKIVELPRRLDRMN